MLYSCTHMATVSVKGLRRLSINKRLSILLQLYTLTVITGTVMNHYILFIAYSALYAIARPSAKGRIIQKTVEDRIMKFSPYHSTIPIIFVG